jgi:hypothetical protein
LSWNEMDLLPLTVPVHHSPTARRPSDSVPNLTETGPDKLVANKQGQRLHSPVELELPTIPCDIRLYTPHYSNI